MVSFLGFFPLSLPFLCLLFQAEFWGEGEWEAPLGRHGSLKQDKGNQALTELIGFTSLPNNR